MDGLWYIGEVGGPILIESSAEGVRNAYVLVESATAEYMRVEECEPAGSRREDTLVQLAEAASAKAEEVIVLARDEVAGPPLPVSDPGEPKPLLVPTVGGTLVHRPVGRTWATFGTTVPSC